jgi:hypothetical protein
MTQDQGTPPEHAYTLKLSRSGKTLASIHGVSYETARIAFPSMLADHAAADSADASHIRRSIAHLWDELDDKDTLIYRGLSASLSAAS